MVAVHAYRFRNSQTMDAILASVSRYSHILFMINSFILSKIRYNKVEHCISNLSELQYVRLYTHFCQ